MAEKTTEDFIHRLQVGFPLTVQQSNQQRAASVTRIAGKELGVQLATGQARLPLKEGEKVRLKYWDEQGIYYCHAEISKVFGPGNQQVELSLVSRPVAVQRRRTTRFRSKISISFEVIEAVHRGLSAGKVFKAETVDLSGSGLSFETNAPLKTMDLLKLDLPLSRSQTVSSLATVVTSERVKRGGKYVTSIGVEFSEMLPETRNQIVEFVSQLEVKGGPGKGKKKKFF